MVASQFPEKGSEVRGYRFEEKIGEGGFGQVWKAIGDEGEVAIKCVGVSPLNDRATIEFENTKCLMRLDHPYLLKINGAFLLDTDLRPLDGSVIDDRTPDVQVAGRPAYVLYVMPLADFSLEQRIQLISDGLELTELLDHVGRIAAALDFLNYDAQIQHRDVKPGNILLLDGQAYLADFGEAKLDAEQSMTASLHGTLRYMAPEVIENRLSKRTDQYSLALTYFHLRTGKLPPPPIHSRFWEWLQQLDLGHVNPPFSAQEREIVAKAAATNPDARFDRNMSFVNALRAAHNLSDKPPVPVLVGGSSRMGTLESGHEPIEGIRLVKCLGRGAFGTVWKCRRLVNQQPCALKFVSFESSVSALREYRAFCRIKEKNIRHDNLIELHEIHLIDDYFRARDDFQVDEWARAEFEPARTRVHVEPEKLHLAIEMEVGDRNLDDRLEECRRNHQVGIPVDELLEYIGQAASALDELSKHHLVHRDVKPQNMLLKNGTVKVCDFGSVATDVVHSREATIGRIGTVPYAPPEQFIGHVTQLGDQYSLACTYIHLRTDRFPKLNAIAPVDVSHIRGPAEKKVLAKATSQCPNDRYKNSTRFVTELRKAIESDRGRHGLAKEGVIDIFSESPEQSTTSSSFRRLMRRLASRRIRQIVISIGILALMASSIAIIVKMSFGRGENVDNTHLRLFEDAEILFRNGDRAFFAGRSDEAARIWSKSFKTFVDIVLNENASQDTSFPVLRLCARLERWSEISDSDFHQLKSAPNSPAYGIGLAIEFLKANAARPITIDDDESLQRLASLPRLPHDCWEQFEVDRYKKRLCEDFEKQCANLDGLRAIKRRSIQFGLWPDVVAGRLRSSIEDLDNIGEAASVEEIATWFNTARDLRAISQELELGDLGLDAIYNGRVQTWTNEIGTRTRDLLQRSADTPATDATFRQDLERDSSIWECLKSHLDAKQPIVGTINRQFGVLRIVQQFDNAQGDVPFDAMWKEFATTDASTNASDPKIRLEFLIHDLESALGELDSEVGSPFKLVLALLLEQALAANLPASSYNAAIQWLSDHPQEPPRFEGYIAYILAIADSNQRQNLENLVRCLEAQDLYFLKGNIGRLAAVRNMCLSVTALDGDTFKPYKTPAVARTAHQLLELLRQRLDSGMASDESLWERWLVSGYHSGEIQTAKESMIDQFSSRQHTVRARYALARIYANEKMTIESLKHYEAVASEYKIGDLSQKQAELLVRNIFHPVLNVLYPEVIDRSPPGTDTRVDTASHPEESRKPLRRMICGYLDLSERHRVSSLNPDDKSYFRRQHEVFYLLRAARNLETPQEPRLVAEATALLDSLDWMQYPRSGVLPILKQIADSLTKVKRSREASIVLGRFKSLEAESDPARADTSWKDAFKYYGDGISGPATNELWKWHCYRSDSSKRFGIAIRLKSGEVVTTQVRNAIERAKADAVTSRELNRKAALPLIRLADAYEDLASYGDVDRIANLTMSIAFYDEVRSRKNLDLLERLEALFGAARTRIKLSEEKMGMHLKDPTTRLDEIDENQTLAQTLLDERRNRNIEGLPLPWKFGEFELRLALITFQHKCTRPPFLDADRQFSELVDNVEKSPSTILVEHLCTSATHSQLYPAVWNDLIVADKNLNRVEKLVDHLSGADRDHAKNDLERRRKDFGKSTNPLESNVQSRTRRQYPSRVKR